MWWDTRAAAAFMPAGGWVEPGEHAENPSTKRRLKNLLDASGLSQKLTWLEPRMATEDEIARLHTRDYMARMKAMSAEYGGDAGELTPFGPGGYEIALLAVGGALATVDAVLDGTVDNAYGLIRPPGHHAEKDLGRGFCMFGNSALAAAHLRQARGLERVAVVDWDVHHGNGTQHAFESDPTVLTISLHQDNYYPPDSGHVHENGDGAGKGANLNVPLPAGSGVGAYVYAFEQVVAPALRRFRPQFVIIASGLDASALDPLARQQMHSDGYRQLTQILMDASKEVGAKLAAIHEGGYSSAYVPFCGLAVIETLAGISSGVEDPFLPVFAGIGGQDLQPHQKSVVDEVAKLVPGVPA
jgi:acetoin utilization deacetylase AcuC-like enzyme